MNWQRAESCIVLVKEVMGFLMRMLREDFLKVLSEDVPYMVEEFVYVFVYVFEYEISPSVQKV